VTDAAAAAGGLEIFVISGALDDGGRRLGGGAWLREPHGIARPLVAAEDTTLYLKRNHLKS
jgi:hypothetical protein